MKEVVAFFMGALFMFVAFYVVDLIDPQGDWECPQIQRDIRDFRECLESGNGCRVDGPEAFGLYHKQVDWELINCKRR